jgi:hypothetical protein
VVKINWGLLGPQSLASERRTRTLGLGVAVRFYNDRAVPGLGGVWFGKQLFLAVLGVAIAERLRSSGKRVQNIEVANAVEALACWLALKSNNWKSDPRLRGAVKLRGKTDFSFAAVRKRSFYVTQPMRQATVQPLRELAFVNPDAGRFNAFGCADLGSEFIRHICSGFRPHMREVPDLMVDWAKGGSAKVNSSDQLMKALSPLEPMPPQASEFLRERLIQPPGEDALRRTAALAWVAQLQGPSLKWMGWDAKPPGLREDHWNDLHAGALFFGARDSAIALLDQVELHIANRNDRQLPLKGPFSEDIMKKFDILRENAKQFLDTNLDTSPDAMASKFCRHCAERNHSRLLESLLAREGRVLQLRDGMILPGAAFRGGRDESPADVRSSEDEGFETNITRHLPLPENISNRIENLFFLNLDLDGSLGRWLLPTDEKKGMRS